MIEALSTRGITLEFGEGQRGPIEPAQTANTNHLRPRLGATDYAVRFRVEGSSSNRSGLPDNRSTLRIPTRNQPSPATNRRSWAEWVRQKQLLHRRSQSG